MKYCGEHLGRFNSVLSIVAPVGDDPREIVIVHEETVPALPIELVLPFCHAFLQLYEWQGRQIPLFLSRLLIQHHVFELEHHGELAAVRIAVELSVLCIGSPGFPYGDQVALLEGLPAHLLKELMESGAVVGDLLIRLFGDLIDHIQAESSHALVHPPEDHIVDLSADLRILPVQIRLFYGKLMEIILLQLRHPLPGRTAEGSSHVIGILSFHTVSPDVIVMIRIIFALLRLQKPSVLI